MHGAVILGHDEPARFRLPGDAIDLFSVAGISRRRACSWRPHDLLLLLGKVSRETLRAFRVKHPDAPVCDCNVGEYVGRILLELALHSLAGIVGGRRRCKLIPSRGNPFQRL